MTKTDFVAIAKVVNDVATNGGGAGAEWLAHHLANVCNDRSENFDRERFLAACFANSRFPTKPKH